MELSPNKKLVILDLDGTLTTSKSPIDAEISGLIVKLMDKVKVAIMSGEGYPQFVTQFLKSLPSSCEKYSSLFLLPVSGTRMYVWRGSWVEQYSENLSLKEKEKIISSLNTALSLVGYAFPKNSIGPIIEDRGSQITFSALGQNAPFEQKKKWDPDRSRRQKIVNTLASRIPEFDIRIGGETSIDITRKGVNKSFGIRKLEQFSGIHIEDMVFVGDSLFSGGNDYPAKASGIDCIAVSGPEETKKILRDWITS